MFLGKFGQDDRIKRKDVLEVVRNSEKLECLKTFNKLFKEHNLEDDGVPTVDFDDVKLHLDSNQIQDNQFKDYNMEAIIEILTMQQEFINFNRNGLRKVGLSDKEFANYFQKNLIINEEIDIEETNQKKSIKHVWNQLKKPEKNTIDFDTLKQLLTESLNEDEREYSDKDLKLMLHVTSFKGDLEITYEEFERLFNCDIF